MLIGRYSVLDKHPGRELGGGAIGLGVSRFGFNKASMARGPFSAPDWDPASGLPDGYRPPYAWVLPQTAGGLSARKNLTGLGAFAAAIAGGKNAEATLTGAGDMNAVGALIVSLVAALTGDGTITNAEAIAYLQLAAALAGAGDVAGAASALASAAAALAGTGTADATATARGTLAASLLVTGDVLNTANVAGSVWGALAAAYNDAGTMGAKLNSAASGGVDLNALADAVWDHADGAAVTTKLTLLEKILRNKSVTDPATGEFVLYDDDGLTELFRVPLWENVAGTQAYRGQGAERKERLE